MLTELRIRNFAIIESLALPLARGFNVLSGETGAGKSIIVGALGLLLGERATAARSRASRRLPSSCRAGDWRRAVGRRGGRAARGGGAPAGECRRIASPRERDRRRSRWRRRHRAPETRERRPASLGDSAHRS